MHARKDAQVRLETITPSAKGGASLACLPHFHTFDGLDRRGVFLQLPLTSLPPP